MTLSVNYQFSGRGNWSLDAVGGSATGGGTIDAEVPVGSTVQAAFLYATTHNATGMASDVAFDGAALDGEDFLSLGRTANGLEAFRLDVTEIVRDTVGSGSSRGFGFTVADIANGNVDGYALAIVYSNPNEEERSIILADGSSASAGDSFNVRFPEPIDTDRAGFEAQLSLGIGFGFQANGTQQYSQVDINGRPLTSAAGGEDDGTSTNGGLITIGGIGDNPANPSNPGATPTDARSDDELYDLARGDGENRTPFLPDGSRGIRVDTNNPSNDDNIFFAGFNITGDAIVDSGGNDRPDARDDSFATDRGSAVTFDVLANDIDADGDTLRVTGIDRTGTRGAVSFDPDGTIVYRPASGFAGSDTFTYTVSDEDGLTDSATVTVTVRGEGGCIDLTAQSDAYRGTAEGDCVSALGGDDVLSGRAGADTLRGGSGEDTVFGGGGADRLSGENNADSLVGGTANDSLLGGGGDDTVLGEDDRDLLDGGSGNDSLSGGDDDDRLYGRDGDDTLQGGSGLDRLFGEDGNDLLVGDGRSDTLVGGAGADTLIGSEGRDMMTGGAGGDTFVLHRGMDPAVITDFDRGEDDIALAGLVFAGLALTRDGVFVAQENGRDILLATFRGFDESTLTRADFGRVEGDLTPYL